MLFGNCLSQTQKLPLHADEIIFIVTIITEVTKIETTRSRYE